MRWSKAFLPTLRDDPVDADAPSHRLILRAGVARQLMAGHYSLLPLGVMVRRRIIDIIREEMSAIGAQEFLLPTMHPVDVWERTGRRHSIDVMFTVKNRRGEEVVLGPTHEEIFTHLFQEVRSYKELPQAWYQVQTKYRDEARAKSGLLRVREFTMKDSYSFDVDEAGLDASFDAHKAAYVRIFERLGIPVMPVQASNGSMGGKDSIEFMSPSEVGEDGVFHCATCDYAANVERATSQLDETVDEPGSVQPETFDSPGVRTVRDLVEFDGGAAANRQIKTLVFIVDGRPTLALLRGDHDLVEQKLADATGASSIRPAFEAEIVEFLGASPGSLGAVGVTDVPVIADDALRGRANMTTGANEDDVHFRGVNIERDINVTQWTSLREVKKGDSCPVCGQALNEVKAIEVGHIFKLGRKFTEALKATVLGAEGKPIVPTMGSYGIGIERAMAAIVERHHDEKGIVWPDSVAPFMVAVVALNVDDDATIAAATDIYENLVKLGVTVLFDDRAARPGVKLADVELIGIPWRITVGKRGVANGVVEATHRVSDETTQVPLGDVVRTITEKLQR